MEKFEETLFSFEDKEIPMIQNRLVLACFEKTKNMRNVMSVDKLKQAFQCTCLA
jgi:hypothetical protein